MIPIGILQTSQLEFHSSKVRPPLRNTQADDHIGRVHIDRLLIAATPGLQRRRRGILSQASFTSAEKLFSPLGFAIQFLGREMGVAAEVTMAASMVVQVPSAQHDYV